MEKPDVGVKSKDGMSSAGFNRSTDYLPLPVAESGLGRGNVRREFSDGRNFGIRSERDQEGGVPRRGNSAAEGDYVTSSDLDYLNTLNGQSLGKDFRGNVRRTHVSDVEHREINDENIPSSNSSRTTVSPADHSRPPSLFKLGEKSNGNTDMETKDDLYLQKSNTDHLSHIDTARTVSESSLAGSGDELPTFQHSLNHDAQVSNGRADETTRENAYENYNVIVSGNVRNGQDSSRPMANNPPKIDISPMSKYAALTATDVASESTPKPSASAVFKFPSLKPDRNYTGKIPSSSNKTDHDLAASQAGGVSKLNDPSSFLTAAIVHTNSPPPTEEIPLSIRNLVFLTKPGQPFSGAIDDSGATANPGYLLT